MGHRDQRMNPQNRQQPTQPQQPNLSPEIIQVYIENQKLDLLNEAQRIRIQEKEIEANAAYAKDNLKEQAEFLRRKPGEERKTLITMAVILLVFVILLMGFVIYCLSINEREFIYKILQGLGYLVTTGLGYYFGQRNKKKDKTASADITDAEVVN